MRTDPVIRPRRLPAAGSAAVGLALALAAGLAACAPVAPSDGPAAVVSQALERVAAKDLDGLRGLACAGQEDVLREQLQLGGGAAAELLPGVGTDEVLDAVNLDLAGLEIGDAAIEGDVAQVPVTGAAKVTFNADAMRPILRRVLEDQGRDVTDEQLDALLGSLEAFGQEIPVDESIRLVREGGAWKVCQETFEAPAAP